MVCLYLRHNTTNIFLPFNRRDNGLSSGWTELWQTEDELPPSLLSVRRFLGRTPFTVRVQPAKTNVTKIIRETIFVLCYLVLETLFLGDSDRTTLVVSVHSGDRPLFPDSSWSSPGRGILFFGFRVLTRLKNNTRKTFRCRLGKQRLDGTKESWE